MRTLGVLPTRALAGWWLAALLAGCGADPAATGATGATVIFVAGDTPRYGDVPFPSDLYRHEGGVVVPGVERIATKQLDTIATGLAALDGFGRATGASFFLSAAADPTSFVTEDGATRGALLVDIDPDSSGRGRVIPAVARYLPSLGAVTLLPLPGLVLAPGTRHAAALTRTLRAADGGPLHADVELERIARLPAAARSTASERLYGDALDALHELGAVASPTDVAGLAVFTTSSRVSELAELADGLRAATGAPALLLDPAAAAPFSAVVFGTATSPNLDDWLGTPDKDEQGVEWPGGDNPGGIAHDAIGAIASGAFVTPSYLHPSGHFERDADGRYTVADPTAKVPVTIVIPRAPAPPAGYPVVVNGHGLSNHRGSMLAVANELARAGFATVGIDDVAHGARLGIPDERNNYLGPYQGPDGIPDEFSLPLAFFANLSDFVAIRDNFRQTILDQVGLVRLVRSSSLDLAPLGAAQDGPAPKLDGDHVFWHGGSLGGIVGSMTIAVEPNIRGAALVVPGGGFAQFITTQSAKMSALVNTIVRGSFGIVGEDWIGPFDPAVNLLAQIMEAGDPLAYAPHVLQARLVSGAPPAVLVTYALGDEVLPNLATQALIRALGIPIVGDTLSPQPRIDRVAAPVAGNIGGVTAGAVEYSPANHALGFMRWDVREYVTGVPLDDPASPFPLLDAPRTIELPVREHCAQVVHFFESAMVGQAEIVVTAPPEPLPD